jgi:integrase
VPYSSKEWLSVVYRGNKLIGIKQHYNDKKRFMLEVNIKHLRKRKFITIENKEETLVRAAIDEYFIFRADIKSGYFLESRIFKDMFKRMLLIKNTSHRWRKLQEATFKNHIEPFIGDKNIKDIKTQDIDEIMIKARDKAAATRKSIIDIVKSVMRHAVEEKIIKELPFEARHNITVNSLQQKTLVTNAQDKLILVHRAITIIFKDDPSMRSVFLFGLYGRRKTEVLKMRWRDIDFEHNHYTIPGINSKVKIDFVFSLPLEIATSLKSIKGTKRGLIFKNPNTKKEYTNINKHIKHIRKVSGWKDYTFHSMRNLLASSLHSRGIDASHISSILGHTNPNTIKQYLTMERVQPIIEKEIRNTVLGITNQND